MHPTDFSAASTPAFKEAARLARTGGATLLLLHVINPTIPPDIGTRRISPPTYQQLRKVSREWALEQLARLTARARAAKVRSTSIIREGAEAVEIARLARSRRAAMIVMGTHGRTGLGRVFLGSVARRVLSLARCPIVTVRGR